MAATISGTSGVTYPSGGVDNVAGAGVGPTDTQTLTNKTLTSPNIGGTPVMNASVITSGTAVASTSGTSIDFTSLPSWIKRITVIFQGVSSSGTSVTQVQLGTGSTTYTTSGYVSAWQSGTTGYSQTTGFGIQSYVTATDTKNGSFVLTNITGNTWVSTGLMSNGGATAALGTGSIALAAALTAIRITTVNGTDTFDAGSINILYE